MNANSSKAYVATATLREALRHVQVEKISVQTVKDCLDLILSEFPEESRKDMTMNTHLEMVNTFLGRN